MLQYVWKHAQLKRPHTKGQIFITAHMKHL